MTRPVSVFLLLAVAAGAVAPAAAQTRRITGRVEAARGVAIAEAQVEVAATRIQTTADSRGAFSVTVPEGPAELVVRAIGYRSQRVQVPVGVDAVTVTLARDVFRLEDVVVTGQATGVQRRNLPNAVATVTAADLGDTPTPSIEQQLQGKVAGADIQTNSGAPGGGVQVRLRGITSINATAEPLYVVDGIVVSDVSIPSNQNAVTAAAGGSNPSLNQDGQVNRIADLNPSDIDNIEILKGASASAIYGGRASNGVVIITTKRGRVGRPQVNLTQRFGVFALSNEFGSRRFASAAEVDAVYGEGTAAANNFDPAADYNLERQLAGRKDLSFETTASLSGGTEDTKYFASASVKNDEGIIQNTGFQRQTLRLNLDQRFSPRISATINTNLLHTKAGRGLTNNDNTGTSYYVVFSATPSFANLTQGEDGLFRENPFTPSNPLQTAALSKNDEDVWRLLGGSTVTLSVLQSAQQSLQLISTGGVDFFSQKNDLFFPPELQFEPNDGEAGTALLSNSDNLNLNLSSNLVYTFAPAGSGFSSTTSAGLQYGRRTLNIFRIVGRETVGGQSNVDAAVNQQSSLQRSLIKNLGYYIQEELLTAGDRLLLTAGVRADQSSLNADSKKLFVYPKAAASYRFDRSGGLFTGFKLRAAYGESGNEPLFGQIFTPLDATGRVGGLPGLVVRGTTGAPDLRPERQREFEGGIDAILREDLASLELSVYQKNVSDLFLPRALAPSSGFETEFFNGGKLRTRGVEMALAIQPIRRASATWLFRTTFSTNSSRVTELEVPPFLAGGFGTALGAFRIEEGASPTQIVGNDTLPDGSIHVVKLGDANPDFRMSFTNDFTFGRFSLHSLLDWQKGSSILNLTKLLYDFGSVTEDFADPIEGSTQTVGQRRLAGFTRTASNYLESASFLKLREVTVSYDLPDGTLSRLFGATRYVRLSVSARNLFTSTPYTGLDPEVSNFGNRPIDRNIDVAPFPPSRSFWFTVDLGL